MIIKLFSIFCLAFAELFYGSEIEYKIMRLLITIKTILQEP